MWGLDYCCYREQPSCRATSNAAAFVSSRRIVSNMLSNTCTHQMELSFRNTRQRLLWHACLPSGRWPRGFEHKSALGTSTTQTGDIFTGFPEPLVSRAYQLCGPVAARLKASAAAWLTTVRFSPDSPIDLTGRLVFHITCKPPSVHQRFDLGLVSGEFAHACCLRQGDC